MSDSGDHDLLLRLIAKFDSFYEEFRRVSNGIGFPRCAERLARLEAVENDNKVLHKRIDDLKAKLWWAVASALAAGGGFVISILKGGIGL